MLRRNSSGARFRGNAEPRVSARPLIVLDHRNQSRLDRISFDMLRDPIPFLAAPHPVIVGFPLPKRLAGSIQNPVRLPRRGALKRFQKLARRNYRQEQGVNVIRHDGEWAEPVLIEFQAAIQGIDDDFRDCFLRQVCWTTSSAVQIRIDPGEGYARGRFCRPRKAPSRQNPIESPGHEQPAIFRVAVRQASARVHQPSSGVVGGRFSRSLERERGTRECVAPQ